MAACDGGETQVMDDAGDDGLETQVQDSFGHGVGDELLVGASNFDLYGETQPLEYQESVVEKELDVADEWGNTQNLEDYYQEEDENIDGYNFDGNNLGETQVLSIDDEMEDCHTAICERSDEGDTSLNANGAAIEETQKLDDSGDSECLVDSDTSTDDDDDHAGSFPGRVSKVRARSLRSARAAGGNIESMFGEKEGNDLERVSNVVVCNDNADLNGQRDNCSSDDSHTSKGRVRSSAVRKLFDDMSPEKDTGDAKNAPGLSYVTSQEPGDMSQANALEVIDNFISVNDVVLSQGAGTIKPDDEIVKSPPVSSKRGASLLAAKFVNRLSSPKALTFDWVDSHEDESGGEFFSKRKDFFFQNNGCPGNAKSILKKCGHGAARMVDGTDGEVKMNAAEKYKCFHGHASSDSRLVHQDKTRSKAVQLTKSKKNLFCNFEKQKEDIFGSEYNVGPDTQMAVEAMEALAHSTAKDEEVSEALSGQRAKDGGKTKKVRSKSKKPSTKRISDISLHIETRLTDVAPSEQALGKPEKKNADAHEIRTQAKSQRAKSTSRDDLGSQEMAGGDKHGFHSPIACRTRSSGKKKFDQSELPSVNNATERDILADGTLAAERSSPSSGHPSEKQTCAEPGHLISQARSSVKAGTVSTDEPSSGLMADENIQEKREVGETKRMKVSSETSKKFCSTTVEDLNGTDSSPVAYHVRSFRKSKVLGQCGNGIAPECSTSELMRKTDLVLDKSEVNAGTSNKSRQTNDVTACGNDADCHMSEACKPSSCAYKKKRTALTKKAMDGKAVDMSSGDNAMPTDCNILSRKRRVFVNSASDLLETAKKKRRSLSTKSKNGSISTSVITKSSTAMDEPLTLREDNFCTTAKERDVVLALKSSDDGIAKDCEKSDGTPARRSDSVKTVARTPARVVNEQSPVISLKNLAKASRNGSHRASTRREVLNLEISPELKDSRRRKEMANVRVLFSRHVDEDELKKQKKNLVLLGISEASSMIDATHFVADSFFRTRNMLEAMALGKPVVTPSWLESCTRAGCFIDEKRYILTDAKKEKEIGFTMANSLAAACKHPLLKGMKVFITSNVHPSREILAALVKAASGQPLEKISRSMLKEQETLENILFISCEEDYQECLPFLKRGANIFGADLLLNGIVIQKLEYDRHRLFVDHVKLTRSTLWVRDKPGGQFHPVPKCA